VQIFSGRRQSSTVLTYFHASAMGKTKWSSESGSGTPPAAGFRSAAAARPRQSSQVPGRMVHTPVEALPLSVLLRQIMLRLRRTWIALRFQANRYTFGLFRRRAVLKLGVLATFAYYSIFTGDGETGWLSSERFYNPEITELTEGGAEVTGESIFGTSAKAKKVSKKIRGNDAAPVSAAELREEEAFDYVSRYAKTAQQEMEKYGIPASISLAQGLIESRAGTSTLATRNNNHFGIKCFSRQCRKGHCTNHTDDTHKDFFRSYKSPWESWRAHSQMLASGRYAGLKKYGRDYRKWAYGLKSVGYATDRTYAEKLIGVIERYDLHRYDK
jgi:flagellum-specific peptidoglycan hydrolase FlgJ